MVRLEAQASMLLTTRALDSRPICSHQATCRRLWNSHPIKLCGLQVQHWRNVTPSSILQPIDTFDAGLRRRLERSRLRCPVTPQDCSIGALPLNATTLYISTSPLTIRYSSGDSTSLSQQNDSCLWVRPNYCCKAGRGGTLFAESRRPYRLLGLLIG